MDNNTLLWQGGPNMEVQTQLVAFRQNHVKLAWALINILNAIHRFGICTMTCPRTTLCYIFHKTN